MQAVDGTISQMATETAMVLAGGLAPLAGHAAPTPEELAAATA